jgi:hypothetical protein
LSESSTDFGIILEKEEIKKMNFTFLNYLNLSSDGLSIRFFRSLDTKSNA